MRTRTHVHYWGDDQLVALLEEAKALRLDFEQRRPHISADHVRAMDDRINNLDVAIRLMGEVAD